MWSLAGVAKGNLCCATPATPPLTEEEQAEAAAVEDLLSTRSVNSLLSQVAGWRKSADDDTERGPGSNCPVINRCELPYKMEQYKRYAYSPFAA
ncbi:hypothetical protein F444_22599 [Phytophthora nicotianae P1976]|uniref:Uncharacterized protein n=1 Tax=Phytophthora nicotianae P1976 TaxID=1317066 RepID=A0A080YXB3_PHYNI|nr:hypothetical protein F444_22599 [Phytophthora nicotianae P1976]